MLAERGSLPVNVKFLVEGEEEAGGEAIDLYVREDGGKRLAADCVVISDTSLYAPGQPSLIYGLKGLVLHGDQGHRPQPRPPLRHLRRRGVRIRSTPSATSSTSCGTRETGKILIPGFYDDVRPLEAWERDEFGQASLRRGRLPSDLGVPELFGEEGYTTRERTWGRPTCDVNGIFGGYMGKGAKTVLPSWGGAKVSMRLVPDQDPKKIAQLFTDYVQSVAPQGRHGRGDEPPWRRPGGGRGERARSSTPPWTPCRRSGARGRCASARAARSPSSRPSLRCSGGPVLLLGFGLNDDGLHSPNEKFNISHFYNGIRSVARLLDRLGDL